MLLNIDGLDIKWNGGVQNSYEGKMGWNEIGLVEQHAPVVYARANGESHNVKQFDESLTQELPPIVYGNDMEYHG